MMTEYENNIGNDLIKEIIWTIISFLLWFLYWAVMLLIISFVMNSWITIDLLIIMGMALLFSVICTLIRVIKKLRVYRKIE